MTELHNANTVNPYVVDNFTNILKIFFQEEKIPIFKDLLISQQAIVSGGSVVRSLFDGDFSLRGTPVFQTRVPEHTSPTLKNTDWFSDDIDIYVNAKNCIPLRNFLMQNCKSFEIPKPVDDNGKTQKKESTYTTSLFKRSKIIKIIRFNGITPGTHRIGVHIDLMIVSNSVTLPEVVQKFDLTCCKVFFDGTNVQGWHLEDTIQYKAALDNYFVSSLLTGKKKIQERMEKYKSRGFAIKVDIPSDYVYGSKIMTEESKEEKVYTFEEKMKDKFYDIVYGIVFGTIYKKNYKLAKNNILKLRSVIPSPYPNGLLMCTSPKNRNKVWSMYSDDNWVIAQKMEYQDDGYDREDFNSAADYSAVGKEKEYTSVIKHLREKYSTLLSVYREDEPEEEDDYNDMYMSPEQRSHEKMIYFCTQELPEFLRILGVDPNAPNINPDMKEFLDSIPEYMECFVEEYQDDVKIKDFLSNKKHIVVRSGENVKGFIRNKIVKYIQKKGNFYSGEKIRPEDLEKLQDRKFKLYDLVNTGLPFYILVNHTNVKFLTNPQSPKK
jgi:hypothetical protein